jgi:hypothetical protein
MPYHFTYRLLAIIGLFVVQHNVIAQDSIKLIRRLPTPRPIDRMVDIGINIATDGLGIQMAKMYAKPEDEKETWRGFFIHLSEKKHPKQSKEQSIFGNNNADLPPQKFVYGKINNFYQLKLGYQWSKPIAGKLDDKTVQVHLSGGGGLSVGILKPYYLKIVRGGTSTLLGVNERYNSDNADLWLDRRFILGGAGFSKGLFESKLSLGAMARVETQFEYEPIEENSILVSIGVEINAFASKPELMINATNKSILPSAYMALRFTNKSISKEK